MIQTDLELIARVVSDDDHEAFGELVRRYQSPLRSWLRRLTGGNEALADDLAQEAFLRAYRQIKSFRCQGKFSTWLFGIAYNQFRGEARRPMRYVELEEEFAQTLAAPSETSTPSELKGDLEEAMNVLTVEQKAAITLCYQQGMTHEEAATVLNWPLGTLKTNILRGKERLQRYFQEKEKV